MHSLAQTLVYAFVFAAYAFAAGYAVRRMLATDGPYVPGAPGRVLVWAAWLAHVTLIAVSMHDPSGLRFGFAQALSLLFAVAVMFFLLEEMFVRIHALRPPLLGGAALAAMGPYFYSGGLIHSPHWPLTLHLWLAMLSYAVIGVAAVHALLMVVLERSLQGRRTSGQGPALASGRSGTSMFARNAPPLIPLEQLLFKLIRTGFVLLTLALAVGLALGLGWFGAAGGDVARLRLDHKTLLSVFAWITLALLLAGRSKFGWRGKTAVRWTLTGFVMLSLAYVGSRFVLEAVLKRFGG
jgi:ABC-type uncharacterized transport system permease subunit